MAWRAGAGGHGPACAVGVLPVRGLAGAVTGSRVAGDAADVQRVGAELRAGCGNRGACAGRRAG